ncbi:hypothetical protein [Streptomyces sp. TR02-1]|uniref:hypothetical protein n=1 Tax=Streptomyces sp. TR02-1 TaxID=3385977 RepID=UPI0039A32EE0
MPLSTRSPRRAARALAAWPARRWAAAAASAAACAVLIGVPTAVLPTPLFSRSVPVQWWNLLTLALTSVLAGIVLATYVRRPGETTAAGGSRSGSVGGVLSFFAVGCPVCNKLVLLLLGTSGALTYWAPLQPAVALASVVLLAEAALRRLPATDTCPAPAGR